MLPKLTDKGFAYAADQFFQHGSVVASVAVCGLENGWPEAHVALAIETMNAEAENVLRDPATL